MTALRILQTILSTAALLTVAVVRPSLADPITITPGSLNNFRDTRSLNAVGIGQGDRDQFGADVSPNSGTTITGTQAGFTVGPTLCGGLAVDPNFCAAAPVFNSSRIGAWNLTFTNGANTATTATPTLDQSAASPVPFPQSVTITPNANPVTPTISCVVP